MRGGLSMIALQTGSHSRYSPHPASLSSATFPPMGKAFYNY